MKKKVDVWEWNFFLYLYDLRIKAITHIYTPHVKVLGSKTLGLNVLELQFVMLANHDQNVFSLCFRLAQSVFICEVGIECSVGFTV